MAKKIKAGKRVGHPIDVHVGQRIRERRVLVGLSQEQVGKKVDDLTFQQIQKYENGSNRVSASKLWMFGLALDVPVEYFFADMPRSLSKGGAIASKDAVEAADNPLLKRETLELVRNYYKLKSQGVRDLVRKLAAGLAGEEV